jgi:hypothetical protein
MSIDGTYQCEVITEGGDPTSGDSEYKTKLISYGVMKLYQQDGELKGSMFPVFFWYQAPFRNGKTDGRHFSYTVYFNSPCQQYAMDVEGEVDDEGNVTGTATNPMGVCKLVGKKVSDEILTLYPLMGRM